MRIVGEWLLDDDGVTRPIIQANAYGQNNSLHGEGFLLDTGADRTVFSAALVERLGLPPNPIPPALTLSGIGGSTAFALLTTVLELMRDDGGTVRIRGEFAGFSDPTATDLSVLGRDILGHFDVILSQRRNEICLLAPRHQYRIERA